MYMDRICRKDDFFIRNHSNRHVSNISRIIRVGIRIRVRIRARIRIGIRIRIRR
jgi:hypothetical protein